MQTDRLLFRLASGLAIRGGFVARDLRIPNTHFPDEYVTDPSHWFIWINANEQFTYGTQLRLYEDGRKEVVLIRDDGTEDVIHSD